MCVNDINNQNVLNWFLVTFTKWNMSICDTQHNGRCCIFTFMLAVTFLMSCWALLYWMLFFWVLGILSFFQMSFYWLSWHHWSTYVISYLSEGWRKENHPENVLDNLMIKVKSETAILAILPLQGILKGEVSLYHWPPVWLVWNQLYD